VYGLLVTGIMHGTAAIIDLYWGWQGSVFSGFIGLLLSAPFFIGMLKKFTLDALSIEKRSPIIPITFGILTILLFSVVVFSVSGKLEVSIFSLVIFSGLAFFLRSSFKEAYTWIEREWIANQKIYDEKDIELGPWEENLSTLLIGQNSNAVEKTIHELELRSKYGVTVIALQRGRRKFVAPPADMRLLPFDKVLVLGSEQEVHVLSDFFLCEEEQVLQQSLEAEFTLASYEVQSGCTWDKHSLRDLNLAASFGGIVVGVERKDEKIVSPQADFVFNSGDFVWITIVRS